MDAREGAGTDLTGRLEDAGFTLRQASRLVAATAGTSTGSRAGSPSGEETASLIRDALEDLRFPVGIAAERRRAELWRAVFPASADAGATGPGPMPGWFVSQADPGTMYYWNGMAWAEPPPANQPNQSDPDSPRQSSGVAIAGFCLGIAALVLMPRVSLLPAGLALAIAAIVFSAIALDARANRHRPGLRGLAVSGLVLGTLAAVLMLTALMAPSLTLVGVPLGVVVQ